MAQGLGKYFNSTTTNGRANVAKVTYASIALIYLAYRMRRRGGGPPPNEDCNCRDEFYDDTRPSGHPPKGGKDCPVCRDRSPKHSHDDDQRRIEEHLHDGHKRKCPCEEKNHGSGHGNGHGNGHGHSHTQAHIPPNLNEEGCTSYTPQTPRKMTTTTVEGGLSTMHDAVFRALRGVVDVVIGKPGNVESDADDDHESSKECDLLDSLDQEEFFDD